VNFINGEQKTLPAARRPAAHVTLSRMQDQSGYHKIYYAEIKLTA